ncbi:MAG: hypothetical protein OHK0022_27260 [Roseiflexaceae bacterium]
MAGRRSRAYLQRRTHNSDQDTIHTPWHSHTTSSLLTLPAFQSSAHQSAAALAQGDQQATGEQATETEHATLDYSFGQISLFASYASPSWSPPALPVDTNGPGQLAQEHSETAETTGDQEAQDSATFEQSGFSSLPFNLGTFPPSPPEPPAQPSGGGLPFVQARLTVGRTDDPFEAEAERVAQRIVHTPAPQPGWGGGHRPAATLPAIQAARADQQAGLSLDDPALEAEILGLSGGEPLPSTEQSFFEAELGYRLDDVRLHTGAQAERLANSLNAQAFTVGQNIVFGPGTYAPGTTAGRYLLAHELTHTIQQTGGRALAPLQSEAAAGQQAFTSPSVQTKQIQRAPVEDEGICPVCGKVGKGTCPGCGSPFVAIQRMPIAAADRVPDPEAPTVQRLGWDDAVSFGKGLVNGATEGLGNLAGLGVDAFATLIRQIAPGLADLISNGPIGMLTELITDGVKGWLQSLLGNINLGGMVDQLTGSFSAVFAMVKGLVNGDPTACAAVASTLNGLRELAQNFAENPVVQQAKELFGSIQGTFDQVRNLITAPVIDTLLELGGTAFDGIRAFAGTIAGWASEIRSTLGAAWDWASQQLGLTGGSDEGGIFEWLKEQASTVWNTILQTVEPVIGPLKTVGMLLLAFSPAGPIYLLVKYGPQLVEMADWVLKHSGDPDIVKKSHEEMGNTILPQILETVQGFGQTVSQVASELASSALQLGQSVLILLEAVSGVPLLGPAQSLIQTLSDNIQKLVAWAQETFSDVAKDVGELFNKIKQTINPYIEVLTSIGMAIAMPGMIPVILAGWAWQKLPDCYKPPIIDFLLDICITFLENAPDLPMLGPLWPLLKSGVIGFLQGLRGQDPGTKIAISNRLAKIISGSSPSFLLGFAKGLLKGIWEGLTDPFVLAYTLLTVLSNVVNWLEEAVTPQTQERAAAPAATAVQSGTPAVADPQPAGGSAATGADQSLQERARAMAGELQPLVEQVTGGFLPAAEEFFTGGEGLSFEQIQQKLGEAWSGALEAMRGAGGQLADAACEFFTKEGADQQIGEGVGWLAGTIAVEVVLGILTAGTITALKPLQGIARLLTWTDGVLEGAFKALSRIGGIVLDGLRGLRRMFSDAAGGAIRTVLDALDEIGAKLVQFGDELLGKADDVARVSPGGADNVTKVADDAAGATRVLPAEQEVLEQTASKRGPDLTSNELEAELDIVRRNEPHTVADGDYVGEVALPNGHEWKRHQDGRWCRFSAQTDLCVPSLDGNDIPYDPRAIREALEQKYPGQVTSTTVPPSDDRMVHMAGQAHPVTGIVFDRRGFPIFDDVAAYDTRIPSAVASVRDRTTHMEEATRDLHNAIQRGMPHSFTPQQLQDIANGRAQIDGFTWHHHQDTGRMQLIPRDIHRRTGHLGGFEMWFGR